MGIKTYFIELIKGDQAADTKPIVAPFALQGQWVENPAPAPRELLRALAEAAAMYRDHIHSQSADGTLPFTLSSIVAHVPEPYLKQVAFGRQPINVRIANAKRVLGPGFAKHAYIDCSELTDWVIQKKAPSAPAGDDGFEDAYVASPDSRIGVEFAFEGRFLSEAETAARKSGGNRVERQRPNGAVGARSEPGLPRTMLDYRLIDDAGNEIEKGTLTSFPVTVGRDNSAIAVPRSHKLVSGPQVEFSTDAAGHVLVTDVGANNKGSTNGTWLESGAQLKRLVAATRLPASGRLILGADRPVPRAAVLEFSVNSPRAEAPRRTAGSHERTVPTEGPSKEPSQISGAAPTSRVAETKITSLRRDGRFGTLALMYSNGDVQTVPIDKLPFTIGRDPELKAEGAAVRLSCERVSRRHVQIEDTGKDGFHARNLALDRSGSYLASAIVTDGFFWSFSKPSDPADGWLKLGGDTLDEETVWGRVYPARTK